MLKLTEMLQELYVEISNILMDLKKMVKEMLLKCVMVIMELIIVVINQLEFTIKL